LGGLYGNAAYLSDPFRTVSDDVFSEVGQLRRVGTIMVE
jgi:hypothetical protein